MLRRSALLALLTVFTGALSPGVAQESEWSIVEGDSVRYTYTPLPQDTPRKKSFLKRIVDYFGESTTDRTFEKKIDFTFAGGPSYSKSTSLGIGVLAAGLYRLGRRMFPSSRMSRSRGSTPSAYPVTTSFPTTNSA